MACGCVWWSVFDSWKKKSVRGQKSVGGAGVSVRVRRRELTCDEDE